MPTQLFTYSSLLFLLVIFLSILFRRQLHIPYDRKLLVSNLIAFISAIIAFVIMGLDFSHPDGWIKAIEGWTVQEKWMSFVVVILQANAILQFLFWLIISLLAKTNVGKIPRFVFDIISLVILVALIFFCTKTILKEELTGLVITSTVLSAVIGLALQGTLSNLFSGLSLQIASPFKLNDWVKIGGHEGKVVSQNWRSVTLLTRENHRVSLTNRFVSEDSIVNYSRPTRRELNNFYIVLDYAHPPNTVKQIMRELIEEIKDIELDPLTGPVVVDYMDSGIKYCMKYWIGDYADVIRIEDEVLTRLWYRLKRDKIKIPYPTQELQVQQVQPTRFDPSLDVDAIVKFLEQADWLNSMDPPKIQELARQCEQHLYAKDDMMVMQNNDGDSMFIIVEGSASVLIRNEKGKQIKVAEKSVGDFFGR